MNTMSLEEVRNHPDYATVRKTIPDSADREEVIEGLLSVIFTINAENDLLRMVLGAGEAPTDDVI